MNGKFAVIADDLTGAMDAGVQLIKKGIKTGVIFDSPYINQMAQMADVIVADTESRNIDMRSAYLKVRAFAETFHNRGMDLIYKKVDSTLRGNIGGEIDAAIDAGYADMVLMAPALPFNGRTTVEGFHYVDGVKLEDSELARDPFSPVPYSYIPDIISAQSVKKAAVIPISAVKKGKDNLRGIIEETYRKGYKIAVADAAEDVDLETIAKAVAELSDIKILLCGSAGLFEYVSGSIYKYCRSDTDCLNDRISRISSGKPIVIISGTPAHMTKAQITYAAQAMDNVEIFRVNADMRVEDTFQRISSALNDKKNIIIDGAGESKEKLLNEYSANRERLFEESQEILGTLAQLAKNIIECFDIGGLVLLGGDTAVSVSRVLGAWGILLIEELEPYVPAGMMMLTGSTHRIPIVTKAGGFGKESTLKHVMEYLSVC